MKRLCCSVSSEVK